MLLEIVAVLGLILTNLICYACNDLSLFKQRLKFPTILFITNRAAQHVNSTPTTYWAFDVLDPNHLVTSDCLNDVALLLLRGLTFAFFIITLLLEGLTDDGFGNLVGWFTFFTNWTFLLFGVWGLLGLALTAHFVQVKLHVTDRRGPSEGWRLNIETDNSTGNGFTRGSVSKKWDIWTVSYLLMTEIVAVSSLFLSSFYWIFLYNPKYQIPVDNLLKHGINNVIIFLELALCRVPLVSYHYQVVLFYGTLYVLFMWIYHAASLHWVYDVLDWSKPLAIGLYLLNPIFLFLAYLFCMMLMGISRQHEK